MDRPNCFEALIAFHEMGNYRNSKANLSKCIDAYRKYLIARASKAKADA